MLSTVAYWIIGVGLAFNILGCIGLVRLPDTYNRAQAAAKSVTMGACMLLLGVGLVGAANGNWPMFVKAMICGAFIMLTSPASAHALCRAAYISRVPLADKSVEDAFVARADEIRNEFAAQQAQDDERTEEEVKREETKAERT
jgi:multicomponent Na+:H+ antiporter subunit G